MTTLSSRLCLGVCALAFVSTAIAEDPSRKWLQSKAYVVPKETCTEGEGYFSIIEGKNGRLYIGTHANAVNSWLVEFDPVAEKMRIAVDSHKAIGKDIKGFGAQSKIHSRNNTGASGKIYFATKQGYGKPEEKYTDYPGGYPMVYDPKTDTTKVYPIPVPHHGVISMTPDESRDIAYISTCSDGKPEIPEKESAHFMILNLKTGKYRDLIDAHHIFAFIVIDHMGRAYHPLLNGEIARYDPNTDKLEKLKQTIDGKPPTEASHLADKAPGHPINWDISPDGKTLYAQPMSTNQLYAYDLTGTSDVLAGRSLGVLVPEAKSTDCRAMCVGPKGQVWVALTANVGDEPNVQYLVSYTPGDKQTRLHGKVAVSNPNFTDFTDKAGKPLPFHAGFYKTKDGVMTTKYVVLGVCQGQDGSVYTMALHPYSALKISPDQLK